MNARRVTNAPGPVRQRPSLAATKRGAQRGRFISRIQRTPDSAVRWTLFIARIARLIDDDEQIDRLLGALVEASPATIAVFVRASERLP